MQYIKRSQQIAQGHNCRHATYNCAVQPVAFWLLLPRRNNGQSHIVHGFFKPCTYLNGGPHGLAVIEDPLTVRFRLCHVEVVAQQWHYQARKHEVHPPPKHASGGAESAVVEMFT